MRRRMVVVVGLVAAAVVFVVAGGWDAVSDGDRIEEFFTERGALGPVVFVVLMWVLQPAGVPGLVFMVPAAVVWPLPTAIALSWVGNMGASTIAFAMARWLARDWAQARLPTRLRAWDGRLARGGIAQVTLFRVLTGQLTPADWLLGVSSVGLTTFFAGTALGIIPGIVVATTLGGGIVDLLSERWARWTLAGLVAAFVVVRRVRRRVSRGPEPSSGAAVPP